MQIIQADTFDKQASELAELVRSYYHRGWVPATSSNFSVRSEDNPEWVIISQSGKDKEHIGSDDFMLVDFAGRGLAPEFAKPSAETLLHSTLYAGTNIGAVLHTHSLNAVLAAEVLSEAGHVTIANLELIKAFSGYKTHESSLKIPVFNNTQDMVALSNQVLKYISQHGWPVAYLIAGHGIYTWGESLADAKRHLEALEYLFSFHLRRLDYGRH